MSSTRRALQDFASKEAKRIGYVSRAAIKLEQILDRFPILLRNIPKKTRANVIDLGSFPGGFVQVLNERTNDKELVEIFGIDLQAMSLEIPFVDRKRTQFFVSDIFNDMPSEILPKREKQFSLVTSDMMSKTTGVHETDAANSLELCEVAFRLSIERLLMRNGGFVCKMFENNGLKKFEVDARGVFETVKLFRPEASRKQSREIFVVCSGFKG